MVEFEKIQALMDVERKRRSTEVAILVPVGISLNASEILKRIIPEPLLELRRRWIRFRIEKRVGRVLAPIVTYITANHGYIVQSGPFAGMTYVPIATGSVLPPKLLGCYEQELHPVLEDIIYRNDYDAVVDVGCAEGYYAIGLALRLPNALVYAYDISPMARRLCRTLAELNGVSHRVTVSGRCDPAVMASLSGKRLLVICDCEGYEVTLLRPDLVPQLRESDILVELHDVLYPGLSQEVLPRFEKTHYISLIGTQERNPGNYPAISDLPPEQKRLAVDEFRPAMQWAFMSVKDPTNISRSD